MGAHLPTAPAAPPTPCSSAPPPVGGADGVATAAVEQAGERVVGVALAAGPWPQDLKARVSCPPVKVLGLVDGPVLAVVDLTLVAPMDALFFFSTANPKYLQWGPQRPTRTTTVLPYEHSAPGGAPRTSPTPNLQQERSPEGHDTLICSFTLLRLQKCSPLALPVASWNSGLLQPTTEPWFSMTHKGIILSWYGDPVWTGGEARDAGTADRQDLRAPAGVSAASRQDATASSLGWSNEKSRTTCHAVAKEQPVRLATSATGAWGVRSSTVQTSARQVGPRRTRLR